MATNNFSGLRFTQDAITGDLLSSTGGVISFVGPDSLTSMSYTIAAPQGAPTSFPEVQTSGVPPGPGPSFPEVQMSGASPYALVLDGTQMPAAQMNALQFFIGEVTWGAGLTAQFLNVALSPTEQMV
ncbi:MAG: hypothetical protein GXP03_13680, partial [Alphaproteobacteria bacterium]|nr:hypothetical protein [Alphaproteobacteria bacterium]